MGGSEDFMIDENTLTRGERLRYWLFMPLWCFLGIADAIADHSRKVYLEVCEEGRNNSTKKT
jgi:hypothetical protein